MPLGWQSKAERKTMLETLPPSSFVPFAAKKLKRAAVCWSSIGELSEAQISQLAYCIPYPEDAPGAFTDETKVYRGERYGGEGIGGNGGGVRCGFDGSVQVKGIGSNPLAGTTTEYWHMHGGASLQEAVREAVWGEVCHAVLPHGAARVKAIVITGTRVPVESVEGGRSAPRALIVRDPALRPAHFMRSIFFAPNDEVRLGQPSDLQRTRAAVGCLPVAFGGIFERQPDAPPGELVSAGLVEMAGRFAKQMAAAHAKRIMHGTLAPSNICLDGRWIDFGTITTLSDYGRVITHEQPDLWLQQMSLGNVLAELHFYCEKFLFGGDKAKLIAVERLLESYQSTWQQSLALEFVKLSGFPAARLRRADPAVVANYGSCLTRIVARGNWEPFKHAPTHVVSMPPVMGAFHLNSILRASAWCVDPLQLDAVLQPLLGDDGLRADLVRATSALRRACLADVDGSSEARAALQTFVRLNAVRLNTLLPDLYRYVFARRVDELVESGEPAGPFIDALTAKACALLAEPVDGQCDLSAWLGTGFVLTETRGLVLDDAPVPLSAAVSILRDQCASDEERHLITSSCSPAH
jgi:hypothetical protein